MIEQQNPNVSTIIRINHAATNIQSVGKRKAASWRNAAVTTFRQLDGNVRMHQTPSFCWYHRFFRAIREDIPEYEQTIPIDNIEDLKRDKHFM